MRKKSSIAPGWWDYTTLDLGQKVTDKIAALTPEEMIKMSRPGFKVVFYDTIEEFYLAEALEFITTWKSATASNPVGICGPIGPGSCAGRYRAPETRNRHAWPEP